MLRDNLRMLLVKLLTETNITNITSGDPWGLNDCPWLHKGRFPSQDGDGEGTEEEVYDSKGAMMFAVATIFIYAMSIMIMIGANLGRSVADDEVKTFLKSYTNLNIRKCEKNLVKTALKKKNISEEAESAPVTPEEEVKRKDLRVTIDSKRKFFTFPIREESFDVEDECSSSPQSVT